MLLAERGLQGDGQTVPLRQKMNCRTKMLKAPRSVYGKWGRCITSVCKQISSDALVVLLWRDIHLYIGEGVQERIGALNCQWFVNGIETLFCKGTLKSCILYMNPQTIAII